MALIARRSNTPMRPPQTTRAVKDQLTVKGPGLPHLYGRQNMHRRRLKIPAATAATATKRAGEESHGPFGIKNAFYLTSRGARAIARLNGPGNARSGPISGSRSAGGRAAPHPRGLAEARA